MKLTHIDHGFYRVSDKDAGALVHKIPNGRLPGPGRETRVQLDTGEYGWLQRTAYSPRCHTDAPDRGWVWAVMVEWKHND